MNLIEMFTVMKWPLLACLLLPGILVYYGLHIVQRQIIFVDLALAQVAALGICLCVMLGHHALEAHTYFWSLTFTIIGALIFTVTRSQRSHRVPQEALIGIVYAVAAAAGILLLSHSAHGNEELRLTLIGEVLVVQPGQVARVFAVFLGVAAMHYLFREQFLMVSFEPERAVATGLAVQWWDFLFYALLGVVVTSFLQIGGVLLVFSYLIVPAVCASFLAESLGVRLLIGWVTATLGSILGLVGSYQFDLPTGATIVCALGGLLVVVAFIARLRKDPEPASEPPGKHAPGAK